MSHDTKSSVVPWLAVKPEDGTGRCSIVLALVAIVVLLDQATKWWGWHHLSRVTINSGGDFLVGRTVGRWYAGPETGGLLDLLNLGVLSVSLVMLVHRRPPAVVLVSGTLMIGGWSSNLLDRLGLHSWTAPGSARGAVDFVPIGDYYFNLADLVIIGATPLFLISVGYLGWRATHGPAKTGSRDAPRPTQKDLGAGIRRYGLVRRRRGRNGTAHYDAMTAALASARVDFR